MLENNYQALLEMYEKKAVLVHDTKNHMRAIVKMLMDGREEGALLILPRLPGKCGRTAELLYQSPDIGFHFKYEISGGGAARDQDAVPIR